jgi:predicted aspartyl protease
VCLLLDTGSNHTVLAHEILERIGCSSATSTDHIRIVTANGVIMAPAVEVESLRLFERELRKATLVAHDLPFAGPIDGLLGMDVLAELGYRIDIATAQIELM